MKNLLIAIIIILLVVPGFSQDSLKRAKRTGSETIVSGTDQKDQQGIDEKKPDKNEKGGKSSLLIFGGYHNYLYGYKDRRYVDTEDQGDFIKTFGQYYGLEYSYLGFGQEFLSQDDIKVGGLINFYYRGSLKSKNLYAVPGHSIPQETILPNKNDRAPVAQTTLGIFGGLDHKWFEVNIGLHGKIQTEYESERLKYSASSTPSNPVYESTKGRGWVWSNSAMGVNFLGRLGLENSAHFTFAVFREDYDPNYGKVMAKIFIPLNSYFKMQVGTFLYPSNAVFIQPVISFAGLSLSPRVGVIVNYRDDYFEKVGILDGAFANFSASYNW